MTFLLMILKVVGALVLGCLAMLLILLVCYGVVRLIVYVTRWLLDNIRLWIRQMRKEDQDLK